VTDPQTPPGFPLVTVVTPSLNHGRFIRETIESVLSQSYSALEYLVIDGGSSDETLAVIKAYGDRLGWVSERDAGQAAAINKGWRRARGDIVAYLNSDDTYLPRALERAVAAFAAHPEADVVYGEGYHVDATGRVLERYPTEPFHRERLAATCFICQPAAFVRRRAAEQVGYLDESLQYCMDYDFWIRLARVATFAHVPEYLATSRVHPETKTLAQRARAHAEILDTVHRHFKYVPPPWIYSYALAALGPCRRDTPWERARFAARLIVVCGVTLVRYNRGASLAELIRWQRWLRHGWRRLGERRA
jgi:glycosyltransferase involved in cell wall biosynthesis